MARFKLGQSGNPNGRPKGSGHRQKLFNELIASKKNELVEKCVELALAGNEQMLKVLLERLLPARPVDEPIVSIGELSGSLTEQSNKIFSLITNGEITPTEGRMLIQAITSRVKLIETDDLVKRIESLEKNIRE